MHVFSQLAHELGWIEFTRSSSKWDIGLSYSSRLIRLFGFGLVSPILIIYLNTSLGISNRNIGLFLTMTLWGDVLLSLLVTWSADKIGRRNMLAIGSILMAIAGVVFATSSSFYTLLLVAVIGVISPSGNEVGPFSAVEVGMLSQLVEPASRVHILMWYQVLGFVGTSLGNLSSGWIIQTVLDSGRSLDLAYRAVFWAYGSVGLLKMVLSLMMTHQTELHSAPDFTPALRSSSENTEAAPNERTSLLPALDEPANPIEENSNPEIAFPIASLISLSSLFAIDSFASALIPSSFMAYFLNVQFHAPLSVITSTLSIGAILSCCSQLLAGSIARRLGIIPTMVFTHMPAQLLTIGFGFAPTLSIALTILWARFSIASMDTSVRSAFLSAIVPHIHRTRFLGIINVSKTLSNSLGYSLSGSLAEIGAMRYSFLIAGLLKLVYDIGLLIGFKSVKLEH
ncbi:hypothetical protein CROQUDRAFT_658936 [Cronartium quercuum f. sp. fusiforme G11]|uniref:Major facilitator superfamily (MFS) profile domain-containing protein n=1 Tax=Cronartium quercuum f. sp. fusiforme G11 TaxID=708437 RepID=A0A9P6TB37_9BASI|nr:hypothetical protein CROQUDRAFT_658936 [Cronartium quercuum f. sp. fusiforme G11]